VIELRNTKLFIYRYKLLGYGIKEEIYTLFTILFILYEKGGFYK